MIGARLKQARLLAGMTQKTLAERLGERDYKLTAAAISKYEKGKSVPPAQFLLLASSVLGVPSTYLTHKTAKTVEWLAFRCRKKLSERERNRIKAHAGDVAELQIELRELLYPHSAPDIPSIPVKSLDDAENAAEELRRLWDVGDRPLDNLVQTSEDREIVIIGWKDRTGLFDGLSGICGERPIAVINTNVPSDRQRLSLAHEIGHLVMDTQDAPHDDEEKLAYRFAAALLVPAKHVYKELRRKSRYLCWGELKVLKQKYGISMSAWVRRAYDLDIISYSQYKSMNVEYKSLGWHKGEPDEYMGDEEPLLLKQMVQRAVVEGLVSPDRMTRIGVDVRQPESEQSESGHLTVYDLLAMPEDERKAVMDKAFELAAMEDFEVFEAYEVYDDYNEEFDAETTETSK